MVILPILQSDFSKGVIKMPKVKIFENNSRWNLEKDINEFIQDKQIINISYSTYKVGYSTYREAIVAYEDATCYPIISGKIADEIRQQLKIGPTDETREGLRILNELFEGREQ